MSSFRAWLTCAIACALITVDAHAQSTGGARVETRDDEQIAQGTVDDRATRRTPNGDERATPGASATRGAYTFTLTPSFATRFKTNVYETRRDRVSSWYADPELLAMLKRSMTEDGRFKIGIGAYVNQQYYFARSARDAGYTLMRGILQAEYPVAGWDVALRYAPSQQMLADGTTSNFSAHDLRLRASREFDISRGVGLEPDRFTAEPRFTLLRRFANLDTFSKTQLTGAIEWDYRVAMAWSLRTETSIQGAWYDRADGFARRDVWLKVESGVFYKPSSNLQIGAAIAAGKRFSNDAELRAWYLEGGPAGEARATLRFGF